ncbi:unnamed protein product [Nezara viridula]|uniref:Uncharacterized protein n=1 Tax=Nezara viridula TaxID=85310 RepID=A0A9P0MT50_NEZVI|nr:unnamed protein product [Nezara viridula]
MPIWEEGVDLDGAGTLSVQRRIPGPPGLFIDRPSSGLAFTSAANICTPPTGNGVSGHPGRGEGQEGESHGRERFKAYRTKEYNRDR